MSILLWIFPEAPVKVYGAPGNIQGNLHRSDNIICKMAALFFRPEYIIASLIFIFAQIAIWIKIVDTGIVVLLY